MSTLHSPSSESTRGHRFLRSVQVLRDARDPRRFDGYLLTEQAIKVVTEVLRGVRDPDGNRAWTITGPYGTGKSACALFLASLLSEPLGTSGAAQTYLAHFHAPLFAALSRDQLLPDNRRLLPVLVSATRQSVAAALATGLQETLRAYAASDVDIDAELVAFDHARDSATIVAAIERLRALAEQLGYAGVVLIIDELGRMLEHAASSAEESELGVLQDLAELAQRSGDRPFVLIGVLHQAFGHYAALLHAARRDAWAKVQGRFRDLVFLETPVQLLQMLATAIAQRRTRAADVLVDQVRSAALRAAAAGAVPAGMTEDAYVQCALMATPLHPVAWTALPYLFRRFAQHERSLFSYLSSSEPFGFRELSERAAVITLPDVFDYVAANLGPALVLQAHGRRWAEAFELLERADFLDADDRRVLKTIALLAALGDAGHLQPREELIVAALTTNAADEPGVRAALERLVRASVLTFRRFNHTYHLWDGSDIDLEARLAEARSVVAAAPDPGLAATLCQYLPPRPFIARRHSSVTGALRYFETRYLDHLPTMDELPPPNPATGADGLVLVYLPPTPGDAAVAETWACSEAMANRPDILIAVAQKTGRLAEVVIELRALERLRETLPELRGDAVARRELVARIAEVEAAVGQAVQLALQPGTVRWFHAGQPRDDGGRPADLSRLVSTIADRLYHATPHVRNELINRRTLSSAAAAGRRSLIEAMLTKANEERLGIAGFPPEASMYASLLHATGLHRRMAGVWRALEEHIFRPLPEPVGVDVLGATLARPPYGVMPGVFPVLFAAFLLAGAGEVALYREGAFLPEPGIADFEVLMRRPELFAVAGFRIRGARRAVLERFARGLGVPPAILPVTRALLRAVRHAPEHARRTRRLAPATLAVREACERATSPEQLLFLDLPAALGVPPFADAAADAVADPAAAAHVDRFFERLNAARSELGTVTETVLAAVRDTLLEAAGFERGMTGWAQLRAIATDLAPRVADPALATFLRRCTADGIHDDRTALESALALLAGRPPRTWSDTDHDHAARRAQELGTAIRTARIFHPAATASSLTMEEAHKKDHAVALIQEALDRAAGQFPAHVVRAALVEVLQQFDV
jgi:hypothetical protein